MYIVRIAVLSYLAFLTRNFVLFLRKVSFCLTNLDYYYQKYMLSYSRWNGIKLDNIKMPKRKNPSSLRSLVIACVGRHFEKICYGCKSSEDVNTMIDTSSYLTNETPLATFPASLLEDMYNLICRRKCNAHYLHSLIQPQIRHVEIQQGQRWNRIFLASGIDFYIY